MARGRGRSGRGPGRPRKHQQGSGRGSRIQFHSHESSKPALARQQGAASTEQVREDPFGIVNRRVRVRWDADETSYLGTVKERLHGGKYKVVYDDGDVERGFIEGSKLITDEETHVFEFVDEEDPARKARRQEAEPAKPGTKATGAGGNASGVKKVTMRPPGPIKISRKKQEDTPSHTQPSHQGGANQGWQPGSGDVFKSESPRGNKYSTAHTSERKVDESANGGAMPYDPNGYVGKRAKVDSQRKARFTAYDPSRKSAYKLVYEDYEHPAEEWGSVDAYTFLTESDELRILAFGEGEESVQAQAESRSQGSGRQSHSASKAENISTKDENNAERGSIVPQEPPSQLADSPFQQQKRANEGKVPEELLQKLRKTYEDEEAKKRRTASLPASTPQKSTPGSSKAFPAKQESGTTKLGGSARKFKPSQATPMARASDTNTAKGSGGSSQAEADTNAFISIVKRFPRDESIERACGKGMKLVEGSNSEQLVAILRQQLEQKGSQDARRKLHLFNLLDHMVKDGYRRHQRWQNSETSPFDTMFRSIEKNLVEIVSSAATTGREGRENRNAVSQALTSWKDLGIFKEKVLNAAFAVIRRHMHTDPKALSSMNRQSSQGQPIAKGSGAQAEANEFAQELSIQHASFLGSTPSNVQAAGDDDDDDDDIFDRDAAIPDEEEGEIPMEEEVPEEISPPKHLSSAPSSEPRTSKDTRPPQSESRNPPLPSEEPPPLPSQDVPSGPIPRLGARPPPPPPPARVQVPTPPHLPSMQELTVSEQFWLYWESRNVV